MIYGIQTIFGTINISLFTDYKKYSKFLTKRGKSSQTLDYYADGQAKCWVDDGNNVWCIVLTIPSKKTSSYYALLVHEAVHCAQFIFENIGENDPASEEQAYMIQAISQGLFVCDADNRKTKKTK